MPMWRGTRPLKRWRYVGVFCDEVMLCVGDARVGPLRQRFWAVSEPGRPITSGKGGVQINGPHVTVDTRDVRIRGPRVPVDTGAGGWGGGRGGAAGVEPRHEDDVWTRKQAGVPASGEA